MDRSKINDLFAKLPFRNLADKIPADVRSKVPVMDKLIPFANQIVCGLVAFVAVVIIACSGGGGGSKSSGGGGRPNPATDFSYDLTEDGQGIIIKGYTGGAGKVSLPSKIEDIPVTEIAKDAFNGETLTINFSQGSNGVGSEKNERVGITSITIPNTVTKIGTTAFANTSITSIVIPDSVVDLGYQVFWGCKNLTEIRLSDNITMLHSLGGSLSGRLESLKKVNLPAKLEKITDNAFFGCSELNELIIPDSIKSVQFLYERTRDEFVEPDSSHQWLMFKGCGKLPIKTRQTIRDWGYKGDF
jgi:hypothetical protein